MESVGQPWRAVYIEIPSDGICAVGLQCVEGIDRIALGLAHLLPIFILDMAHNDNILIRSLIENQC